MISLPLCAVFSQIVISFKAAIWLRITVCGFVMSTSTSGLVPWLANPFPMTWSSYLCERRVHYEWSRQAPALSARRPSRPYLLFAVPFQHSSPGAIPPSAHTVSGNVDQNFFACFSFLFTSLVCTEKKETGETELKRPELKKLLPLLTSRSKLVPAAVVGLASGV